MSQEGRCRRSTPWGIRYRGSVGPGGIPVSDDATVDNMQANSRELAGDDLDLLGFAAPARGLVADPGPDAIGPRPGLNREMAILGMKLCDELIVREASDRDNEPRARVRREWLRRISARPVARGIEDNALDPGRPSSSSRGRD